MICFIRFVLFKNILHLIIIHLGLYIFKLYYNMVHFLYFPLLILASISWMVSYFIFKPPKKNLYFPNDLFLKVFRRQYFRFNFQQSLQSFSIFYVWNTSNFSCFDIWFIDLKLIYSPFGIFITYRYHYITFTDQLYKQGILLPKATQLYTTNKLTLRHFHYTKIKKTRNKTKIQDDFRPYGRVM